MSMPQRTPFHVLPSLPRAAESPERRPCRHEPVRRRRGLCPALPARPAGAGWLLTCGLAAAAAAGPVAAGGTAIPAGPEATFASAVATAGTAPAGWPRFEIIDLGDFGGPLANGHGINDAGHAVGTADSAQAVNRPFLWRNGELTDLGTLMPGASVGQGVARAISQTGLVAGSSMAPLPGGAGAVDHAFVWSQAQGMVDLTPNSTAGSSAWGVNDAGQVVGQIDGPAGGAFLWSEAGGLSMIGLPGAPAGFSNRAEDINASGQVCGHQFIATFAYVGWVFDSATGNIVELPTLGLQSETRAINDAGDVVGASSMPNNQRRPVLWTADGSIVDLGFLPVPDFTQGIANGINTSRWIVGADAYDGSGVQDKGWLWIAGVKVELLTLIEDPAQQAQWSGLLYPLDINDHGAIVGIGIRNGIPGRAFVMRPIGSDAIFGDGFDGP
jgi:probable HAF family extracellular repeat protein